MSSTKVGAAPGRWVMIVTIALWTVFAAGNLVLWFIMESALMVLSLLLTLVLILTEIGLLLRYARLLAQWRMVALAWLVYGLARLAVDRAAGTTSSATAAMILLLVLYAMVAGFGTLIILAILRDVSVIYFILPFAVMPFLLQVQIRASGGLIATLWGPAVQTGQLAAFTWLEPLPMVFSCMIPLAFVTFWGHFFRLLVREQRREPLNGVAFEQRQASSET